MRRLIGLFLLLCPAALSAQNIRVTSIGDTVMPVSIPPSGPAGDDTPDVSKPYRKGRPFGPFSAYRGYRTIQPGPWSLALQASDASGIIPQIEAARARGVKLVLAMTGGAHSNYLTDGIFDRAKWNMKMRTFDTPAIRAAVASAVADGTVIGASVMDEPHVSGSGGGNTWGPPGTMTKARVDSLCSDVKTIFPTLPAGVVHRHDVFEPTKSYRVCDFIVSQYASRFGSVTAFRDAGLAVAKRDGIAIAFSMNILDGGTPDRDGGWNCAGTGGRGTHAPSCRMTATQIAEFGKQLLDAPGACGLFMWRYDSAFMANPENAAAFDELASYAARQPAPPCRRP